jgi:hypothetical protein
MVKLKTKASQDINMISLCPCFYNSKFFFFRMFRSKNKNYLKIFENKSNEKRRGSLMKALKADVNLQKVLLIGDGMIENMFNPESENIIFHNASSSFATVPNLYEQCEDNNFLNFNCLFIYVGNSDLRDATAGVVYNMLSRFINWVRKLNWYIFRFSINKKLYLFRSESMRHTLLLL